MWNLQNYEDNYALREDNESWEASSVCVTPDGAFAVEGSENHTARVWDLESKNCLHTLRGHTSWLNSVCVTPDGLHVVTGSKDKTARVWNLRTGELETTLEHPGEVTDVCPLVHPDGKLVLVAASLDKVHVWPMVHPSVVGVQPSILRLSHGV